MYDVAGRSTDMGTALSTAAVTAAAQTSPTFLYFVDMMLPFWFVGMTRSILRLLVLPQRVAQLKTPTTYSSRMTGFEPQIPSNP